MAGVYPISKISQLLHQPGASPACILFWSGASSVACTQHHGFRNRNQKVPHHQFHNNGASLQKRRTLGNSKRRERLVVQSEITEIAETEQKQEASTSTTSSAPPDDSLMETPMSLEVRGAQEKQHPYTDLNVGNRWRDIQGAKQWEGLFDPLDPVLRGELLRYGEFSQVPYDSFDYDTHSRFCGSCKYSKSRLLHKMGLDNRGYDVTDYIYGTAGEGLPLAKYFKFMDLVDESGNEVKQDAWDRESNWIGYVAVTTDPKEIKRLGRRDIVLVWRGTVTKLEWLENLRDYTWPSGLDPRQAGHPGRVDLKVERGFLQLYKSDNPKSPYTTQSARRQVLEAIKRLVRKYGDEELSITVSGHSLGSALAMISAYDIAETGVNQASKLPGEIAPWDQPDGERNPNQVVEWTQSKAIKTVPVTVFSFGGPRVGNDAFRDRCEELGVKMLRVVNDNDIVPRLPGLLCNERINFLELKLEWLWNFLDSLPWTYSHVGQPLYIDNMISPFLRKTRNPNNAHNLEGYMHILTGFHGLKRPFSPAIFRDLALVNKASDFLHRRYYIPASWWQEENKGLVKTEDGRWLPRTRELVDYPEYGLHERPSIDDDMEPVLTSIP